MVRYAASLFFVFTLFVTTAGQATANSTQEETQAMQSQLDGRTQELLGKPDGTPFDLEYEDGIISRLKIKATVEVSTSLRGARADRLALENATRRARAGFSTFLSSEVVFVESGNEIVSIVEKEGAEKAEYNEASASSINVASQSFQRGLISIMQHCEGEGDRRTCTVVLGWSQKLVSASMQAQGAMKRDPEEANSAPKPAVPQEPKGNSGTTTRLGDQNF